MDIICETAMGIQLQCQTNPNVQFIEATEEMIDLIHKRIFNPLITNDFIYFFTDAGRRQRNLLSILHNFSDNVIHERKQRLTDRRSDEDQPVKMTFLDHLLESHCDGVPLSDVEIRGEVNTFMLAGHETTTSCVSFALFYISRIPDIQQKLYDEIVSVYGTNGDVRLAQITHASLQQLKYMEMVIKETLRISPRVPMIGRTSFGDMTVDGVAIPAGTEIIINIYIMHNDPE
uniref:Cytochrome P450 n=1 Tax=Anopheles atroparvus TaxID=41427 RepID=A0AAG5D300_ANOAO